MKQRIEIGENIIYDDNIIRLGSINGVNTSALVGDMLEIDELRFRASWIDKSQMYEVYMTRPGPIYRDRNQKIYRLKTTVMPNLLEVPYATIVRYYQNDVLRAKMYVDHVDRVSKTDYTVTCISALGILDRQRHLGGVYTGETVQAVIAEIIDGAVPYSVSSRLASVHVYGWLPIENKRAALHQVLFAYGANILKDANGDMYFDYLEQTTAKAIPNDRIFLGGKSLYTPPYTRTEVTEHAYFQSASDETITLYDNTQGSSVPAGNTFIAFSEAPCYDLSATSGLTIEASGVNWAVLTGVGVLTGKKYSHQMGIASRTNGGNQAGKEKVVTSDVCTLVSLTTSSNVARRLMSYYGSAQRFNIDLVRNNESVGDQVQFTSPFGDKITGFVASLDWRVTSIERATAEVVMNYEPTAGGGGSGFEHVVVITSNGTWTIPAGVTEIALVVIGGGSGGQAGFRGADGDAGSNSTSSNGRTVTGRGGKGGSGGSQGSGGAGGKVAALRKEISSSATLAIVIGAGGTGGATEGEVGSTGGNTTVTGGTINVSSASGVAYPNGYYDVIGGNIYASTGDIGNPGAAGGSGGNTDEPDGQYGSPQGGASGGAPGETISGSRGYYDYYSEFRNEVVSDTWGSTRYVYISDAPELNGYYAHSVFTGESGAEDAVRDYTSVDEYTGVFTASGRTETFWPRETYFDSTWALTIQGNRVTARCYRKYTPPGGETGYYLNTVVIQSRAVTLSGGVNYNQFAGGGGGASSAQGGDATDNNGGNGNSPTKRGTATTPGMGGAGGNGGGGGGGGGGTSIEAKPSYTGDAYTVEGGAGGDGAPGCVIIYY